MREKKVQSLGRKRSNELIDLDIEGKALFVDEDGDPDVVALLTQLFTS
jgi:hypothetical protein